MKLLLAVLCGAAAANAASTGGFRLETGGSITSDPAEVVSGLRSIKGSYFGNPPFQNVLSTDNTVVHFDAPLDRIKRTGSGQKQ